MALKTSTLPNLLIIGARKGGTTSLHNYLSLHPQIFMSRQKELSFFDDRIRWGLGIEWYKSNFDASYPINGESSPQYSRYPRTTGVPERIRQVLGAPKLLYAIRDPIDRILSDYTQMVEWKPSKPSFEDLLPNIDKDGEQYIECSSYYLQISQYLKIFPRENLHVVPLERLNKDPKSTLRQVFRFLGVDEDFWCSEFNQRFNPGDTKRFVAPWFKRIAPAFLEKQLYQVTWMPVKAARMLGRVARIGGQPIVKPKISLQDDLRLQAMLREDVAALREFLGDPLPEWRPYR